VSKSQQKHGVCLIAASEGIRDVAGNFLVEKAEAALRDESGQRIFGMTHGVGPSLCQLIGQTLGLRCRHMRPDLIQRSSSGLASEVDRANAALVGKAAVAAFAEGQSGVMIGLQREQSRWTTHAVPLAEVVGVERKLPADFIASSGFNISIEFVRYAQPLTGDWTPRSISFCV
jgi:6-phosphofructokinase 1